MKKYNFFWLDDAHAPRWATNTMEAFYDTQTCIHAEYYDPSKFIIVIIIMAFLSFFLCVNYRFFDRKHPTNPILFKFEWLTRNI